MLRSKNGDNSMAKYTELSVRRNHQHYPTELHDMSSLALQFIPPTTNKTQGRTSKSRPNHDGNMNDVHIMQSQFNLSTEEHYLSVEKLDSSLWGTRVPSNSVLTNISQKVSSARQPFAFVRPNILQYDRDSKHELKRLKLLNAPRCDLPFGLSPQIPKSLLLQQAQCQHEVFHDAVQTSHSNLSWGGGQSSCSCHLREQDASNSKKYLQARLSGYSSGGYPDMADLSDRNYDSSSSRYRLNLASSLHQQQQSSSMQRRKGEVLSWASSLSSVSNRDTTYERELFNKALDVNQTRHSDINITIKPTAKKDGEQEHDLMMSDPFPFKLHRLLRDLEEVAGMNSIAGFLPSGLAFTIWDPIRFETQVMKKYFPRMSTFASFQRQVNLYNFQRRSHEPEKGAYFHPKFKRDCPLHSLTMTRTKTKGLRTRRKKV